MPYYVKRHQRGLVFWVRLLLGLVCFTSLKLIYFIEDFTLNHRGVATLNLKYFLRRAQTGVRPTKRQSTKIFYLCNLFNELYVLAWPFRTRRLVDLAVSLFHLKTFSREFNRRKRLQKFFKSLTILRFQYMVIWVPDRFKRYWL